jgi:uncharacterized membrane protein YedE/YeeE
MLASRCPWYIAGPVLGVLIVALRAAVNKPLGALGGYIDFAEHGLRPSLLGFSAFVLAGTVLGGALFGVSSGTQSTPLYAGLLPGPPALQLGILAIAGLVMGVGARTAGGCTSGHGLTGMSLGSPASIAAAMTFFGTAVALAHFLAWFIGASS